MVVPPRRQQAGVVYRNADEPLAALSAGTGAFILAMFMVFVSAILLGRRVWPGIVAGAMMLPFVVGYAYSAIGPIVRYVEDYGVPDNTMRTRALVEESLLVFEAEVIENYGEVTDRNSRDDLAVCEHDPPSRTRNRLVFQPGAALHQQLFDRLQEEEHRFVEDGWETEFHRFVYRTGKPR